MPVVRGPPVIGSRTRLNGVWSTYLRSPDPAADALAVGRTFRRSVVGGLVEEIGTERESGGNGRGTVDDGGEVVAGDRTAADHRWIAERPQQRAEIVGNADRLHVGQRRRRAPDLGSCRPLW